MKADCFLKTVQKIVAEEELVDFLMWCIEFDVDLASIQGDIISLYRKHQNDQHFAA
ncbi:MAG: hypothetical protein H7A01_11545 [Hahellaceae bacterium]|jgi:hypothetical protein|nr:hypothetical protein [Hahellaceae bacterium]MCP5210049.1 hypothetical protein [Hahellaceae bacterium]